MAVHQYHPQSRPHPGETLREKLQELGMGPKEFALRTCKPEKTVIAVLNGESSITPDMAIAFETVTMIPASFWMNHQCAYDEYVARQKQRGTVEASVEWAKQFPLTEMIKKGWLPATKSMQDKTLALLAFFGIASHTAWSKYYCEQQLKVAFGISINGIQEPHALSAWLRKGEQQAYELKTSEFSASALRNALPEMKRVMLQNSSTSLERLQEISSKSGLKVIWTPMLRSSGVTGAARWCNGNPVVQIAKTGKINGDYWYRYFHQVGHILLHGKKNVFLESSQHDQVEPHMESEADEFAERWIGS
ncbi:MAG: XRE family transcriptional regulator [Ignavibacteria bacterium]|jgi:HTH-type transcriptional regulator/antitoxin HigA